MADTDPTNNIPSNVVEGITARITKQATNRFYRNAKTIYRWIVIVTAIVSLLIVVLNPNAPVWGKLLSMAFTALQIFAVIKLTQDYCD